MIQHAPATARLCALRTCPRVWQMPCSFRLALTPGMYGQHSPIIFTGEANTFYPHQRLFSISTNPYRLPGEYPTAAGSENPSIKLQEEDVKMEEEDVRMEGEGPRVPTSGMPQHDLPADAQTIYALSTAAGSAAIAIIRISGPACTQIYRALCPQRVLAAERYAAVRTLRHPTDRRNILDSDAMVLRFNAPNTVTGEDMLELHVHGGPATVKAVLSAIPVIDPKAIRAANPGEFTRRGFSNNRIDLGQIESLGDILSAETELQRRAALRGRSGTLSRIYEAWRASLIQVRAHIAADTDHSEEHSLDNMAELWPRIIEKIKSMRKSIKIHQEGAGRGALLRKGIQVSLIGLPNAGKSSLFNQILGREASIVNQQAGTTRDVVEATVDVRGYLCTIADTAGVRAADGADIGAIEQEGIKRAIAKAKDADVIVYVTTFEPDPRSPSGYRVPLINDLFSIIKREDGSVIPLLTVINKSDRPSQSQRKKTIERFTSLYSRMINPTRPYPVVNISVIDAAAGRSMEGNMGGFTRALMPLFQQLTDMNGMEDLIGVSERQSQLLAACSRHLQDFLAEAERREPPPDNAIATEHLEKAAKCLAETTGTSQEAGDVEAILSVVFSKFCIGK